MYLDSSLRGHSSRNKTRRAKLRHKSQTSTSLKCPFRFTFLPVSTWVRAMVSR